MAAVTSAAAAGLALIASTTCAAVLVIAPAASVARLTVIALPVTLTLSGASFGAGVDDLGGDVVAALLAPGLGGQDDGARPGRPWPGVDVEPV